MCKGHKFPQTDCSWFMLTGVRVCLTPRAEGGGVCNGLLFSEEIILRAGPQERLVPSTDECCHRCRGDVKLLTVVFIHKIPAGFEMFLNPKGGFEDLGGYGTGCAGNWLRKEASDQNLTSIHFRND